MTMWFTSTISFEEHGRELYKYGRELYKYVFRHSEFSPDTSCAAFLIQENVQLLCYMLF